MIDVLIRRNAEADRGTQCEDMDTYRAKVHMTTGAHAGVKQLQTKEWQDSRNNQKLGEGAWLCPDLKF